MVSLTSFYQTTKHLIDSGEITAELRPYLGMSGLGSSCPRQIWYSFRWAYTDSYPKRLGRLFARGHLEEPHVVKLLEDIGIKVWGDQTEMVAGFGHIKGHCDGICKGVIEAPKTVHLLEIKTASDAAFKAVKKANSIKKSKPVYYAQVQLYMHYLKLTRALWIMVNKNDDDIHIERVRYNKVDALELIRKGDSILMSAEPPRATFPVTWFECKWCPAQAVCRDKKPMEQNCRTCQHVGLAMEGVWKCNLEGFEQVLTIPEQRVGCPHYIRIEQ